jgi:hypothetical protein
MSYLEQIKKLSTYSHLPNFAILSKNKLYLPNSDNQYTILGKWSLNWIHSNRCAIGTVEQDDYQNITFQVTSCYECTDDEAIFKLVPKEIFTEFWKRVYQHDPLLSYIHINISEYYQSSPILSPLRVDSVERDLLKSSKPQIIEVTEPVKESTKELIEQTGGSRINKKTVYDQPKEKTIDLVPSPKNQPKEESGKSCMAVKDCHKTLSADTFQVCKTDKPDVYHVHQRNKYVSTCLIPNMKTSRYMQDLFEDKQNGEMITMNMKLHVNTNKYYPII